MCFDLVAAMISLVSSGFLALMASTGGLARIDSTKVRLFAWIVADLGVGGGKCWLEMDGTD